MVETCKAIISKNKALIALTSILLIAVLVIARYSRWPALPGFQWLEGPVPDDQIPYDLAIGYISCYLFYFIQVFIPSRLKERRASQALGLYLKEYVMYMKILETILKENKLEELPDKDNDLGEYKITDQKGNIIYEAFPVPVSVDDLSHQERKTGENRFMSFLLKIQHVYEIMMQAPSFMNLNEYMIELLQKTDISFWVASYRNLIYMRRLGQEDIEVSLDNEITGKNKLNELRDAIKQIESLLKQKTVVEPRSNSMTH